MLKKLTLKPFPNKFKTLSNGKLFAQISDPDNNTRTDYWSLKEKHAPYLFFMGIGEYEIIEDTYKNIPVNYYVEKEYASVAKDIFGLTPEKLKYAINRYVFEAERHYDILDKSLGQNKYMLGDTYTIVDMCVWGWARMLPKVIGEGELEKRANLHRLMMEINDRPASQRALNINVSNNHNFKVEIDEEASKHMFPQNERLKNI